MSYQVPCNKCGRIYQDLLPIPKKDDSMILKCSFCGVILFEIFGNDHNMTEMVKKDLAKEKSDV